MPGKITNSAPMHNSVRWLSHSKVLRRVYELREKILIFLEIKKIDCDFRENMKSDDWRCDFMFAIEVFEKLNNLNLELQRKGLFAHNMLTKVKAFEAKLLLFFKQTFQNNFTYFALLNKVNVTSKIATSLFLASVRLNMHLCIEHKTLITSDLFTCS